MAWMRQMADRRIFAVYEIVKTAGTVAMNALRIAFFLVIFSARAFAAETELECRPRDQSGKDPIVKISILKEGPKWSVIHRSRGGAIFNRSSQHEMFQTLQLGNTSWVGINKKNKNLSMSGSIRIASGHIIYEEIPLIADSNQPSTINNLGDCSPIVANAQNFSQPQLFGPPLAAPAPPPPSPPLPSRAEIERQRALEAIEAARRIAEERKLKGEKDRQIAAADQSRIILRTRLEACIDREALPLISTGEATEAIAKASLIICQNETDAFQKAVRELNTAKYGSDGDQFTLHQTLHDSVVARIMKMKSDLVKDAINKELSKQPPPRRQELPPV